ncbi:MAG: hypothetical protein Q9184_004888 [Pyrenodesmia sp. 2 TL-2023]
MTAIRKVVISAFGDPSNIHLVDDILPPAPASYAQIRILYSGFSGADINMRLGQYPFQRKAPFTPGYCFVGTIHSLPPSSTPPPNLSIGDTVACLSVYDAQATFVNIPTKHLIPVPHGLDLQKATALILDWNTAYGMVMHTARVSAGQTVFIHGCSGAVGSALLSLCKLQGASVYGTCSEKNFAAIRRIGATPFTYADKAWIPAMRALGGADIVFDALGFESWDESYSILSGTGTLLGYGGNLKTLTGQPGGGGLVIWPTFKLLARNLMFWDGRRTRFYYIDRGQRTFESDLKALFALLGEGKIEVLVKRVWEMEEVREAHRGINRTEGVGSFVYQGWGGGGVGRGEERMEVANGLIGWRVQSCVYEDSE